jgi:hypothetical protein
MSTQRAKGSGDALTLSSVAKPDEAPGDGDSLL